MCFLATGLLVALLVVLAQIILALGVVLPFIICGVFTYISVYCAWPVIERHMLEEGDRKVK